MGHGCAPTCAHARERAMAPTKLLAHEVRAHALWLCIHMHTLNDFPATRFGLKSAQAPAPSTPSQSLSRRPAAGRRDKLCDGVDGAEGCAMVRAATAAPKWARPPRSTDNGPGSTNATQLANTSALNNALRGRERKDVKLVYRRWASRALPAHSIEGALPRTRPVEALDENRPCR